MHSGGPHDEVGKIRSAFAPLTRLIEKDLFFSSRKTTGIYQYSCPYGKASLPNTAQNSTLSRLKTKLGDPKIWCLFPVFNPCHVLLWDVSCRKFGLLIHQQIHCRPLLSQRALDELHPRHKLPLWGPVEFYLRCAVASDGRFHSAISCRQTGCPWFGSTMIHFFWISTADLDFKIPTSEGAAVSFSQNMQRGLVANRSTPPIASKRGGSFKAPNLIDIESSLSITFPPSLDLKLGNLADLGRWPAPGPP